MLCNQGIADRRALDGGLGPTSTIVSKLNGLLNICLCEQEEKARRQYLSKLNNYINY
jgi:hypothetical protein